MAVFHLLTARGAAAGPETAGPPGGARIAGLVSILIWIGVIICGRWIGFTMEPF
jgi:hypothetical protein